MEKNSISIHILGHSLDICCHPDQSDTLLTAVNYLNQQIDLARNGDIKNNEKLLIITALNIVHELLIQQKLQNDYIEEMNTRMHELTDKLSLSKTKAPINIEPVEL